MKQEVNPALRDWFSFADREKYNPIRPSSILTHASFDRRTGSLDDIGSIREEWMIRSVLVDADRLTDVHHPADPHTFDFSPSWEHDVRFDFGDRLWIRDADAYPLIVTRTHPITDAFEIELRPDFRWYHFLPTTGTEFRHPLDGVVVATVDVETHEFFNPTPRVTVHPDYLRDYLAARGFALVIAVVADRFATRADVSELEIESTPEPVRIDAQTMIWPMTNAQERSAWGRSSLYWSTVLKPYDRPRPERSAWHYFGDLPDDSTAKPTFFIDAEGRRGPAADAGNGYLYFKREVLRKYLESPGYGVGFHMRNWGFASTPLGKSVDVGINDEQLVTAFAPDLADLRSEDQAYWASFSIVPSGGVCRELFETRMMLRPPHSPSLPEVITDAAKDLNDAFKTKYGSDLYRTSKEELPHRRHISVGPASENIQEFLDLAKTLYAITVEDMDEKAIKAVLSLEAQPKQGENLRSIVLTERLLLAAGHADTVVRPLTDRLRALNNLRVIEAHVLSTDDVMKQLERWGVTKMPSSMRLLWHVAVDAIATALHDLATLIRDESRLTRV